MTLLEPSPTPDNNGSPKTLYLPHQRAADPRHAPPRELDLAGFPTERRPNGVPAERSEHDEPVGADVTGVDDDHDDRSLATTPPPRSRAPRRPGRFPALRLGRVRLLSLAKIAFVFSIVGFLVTVGTLTLLWNVLLRFGLVDSAEEAVTTGLGLDDFTIAGGEWFDVVVIGVAVLWVFLLLVTVLLGLVYNATCALFGGVAIEAQPVRRLTVRERFLHGVRRWREERA